MFEGTEFLNCNEEEVIFDLAEDMETINADI